MKASAVVRIVIWSLAALILTGILVAGVVFKGVWGGSGDFMIGVTGNVYSGDYNIGGGSITEPINAVEVDWVSGKIEISVYDGETTEIDTVSGRVTAENLNTASLECDTVSGDIKALGAIESFDLDSTSSSAEFEADSTSGDFTIKKFNFQKGPLV